VPPPEESWKSKKATLPRGYAKAERSACPSRDEAGHVAVTADGWSWDSLIHDQLYGWRSL
jgi:hypothetical protein